jgi:aerobic carbon-monoxide dehydrogenase medium subunit
VTQAIDIFSAVADAKWLAGGMTLLPAMKLRLLSPTDLVDLGAIDSLRGIRVADDCLTVGAMTPHAVVARSCEVRRHLPALATLAEGIGDVQVRNRGTIGGSISNNDPAADYPAAVVALGGTVFTDRRAIVADDFFVSFFQTALEAGEVVTHVSLPLPQRAAYAKFPNPASRYAITGVMVARHGDSVRVAVTGAGAGVFRVPEMEVALSGEFSPESLRGIEVPADALNEDVHASAEYRAHLISVMARRAAAAVLAA